MKAVVIDCAGTELAVAAVACSLSRPAPLAAEQDPDEWWSAAVKAVRLVLARSRLRGKKPLAMAVVGQMHGVVAVDRRGQPIRPCLTWADERGAVLMPSLLRRTSAIRIIEITGNAPNAGFTALKLMWLQAREPAVWRRIAFVLMPKDYVRSRLTEQMATDVSDASGTLLMDLANRSWSAEMIDAFGVDSGRLPTIQESGAHAGELQRKSAEELGLPPGIPVAVGAGDALSAALALGATRTGRERVGVLSLGTAGQLLVATPFPVVDRAGRVHALCHAQPQTWCSMAAILDAGSALAWAVRLTGARLDRVGRLIDQAAKLPPGADGLTFLPQLTGERTPGMSPFTRGSLVGLRAQHDHRHLVRSVLEGVAYAYREGFDVLDELGLAPDVIRVAGGGSRSTPWLEILAAVLGRTIEATSQPHASALGAALLARNVAGEGDIDGQVQVSLRRIEPAASLRDVYQSGYQRYLELRRLLRSDERWNATMPAVVERSGKPGRCSGARDQARMKL